MRYLLVLACAAALAVPVLSQPEKPYVPKISPASNEPQFAQKKIKVPDGFEVKLWAAEPMLANPVAFSFDEKGRCYVAETYRLHQGVIDIRDHMNWLDDDLASQTVAQRLTFMKRRMGAGYAKTTDHPDRIVRLDDTKGQGAADHSTVVADDFRSAETGLGAGVLVRGNELWYTCIPDLWHLRLGNDGKVEGKKALHTGYGVHFGFIGHDLHGLVMGPDGKLYFTIGDRGANIVTPQGKVVNTESGSVFRCNPDGSELEIYATGLRNPQKLAFDEFGNLFTVDNNCDAGDQARVTQIIDGGDYGWRIGYQFFEQPRPRHAWMDERMWDPVEAKKSAYIVPPVANLTAGPSGLCYDPGIGLPEKYRGSFFICDFRGGSNGSGVMRFKLEPQGAGFKVKESEQFVWNVLATDCDYGPDGALYVLDWVEGWNLPGKGRIWRVTNSETPSNTKAGRTLSSSPAIVPAERLEVVLSSTSAEERARAAKALGEQKKLGGAELLLPLLTDSSPRVRFFACQRLGRLKYKAAVPGILAVLRENNDQDCVLRAAGYIALARIDDRPALYAAMKDSSAAVRRAVCVALRRLGDPKIADLLQDAEPTIVQEAARAISEAPIPGAYSALAKLAAANKQSDLTWYCALHANFVLGGKGNAQAVAKVAERTDLPELVRYEALDMLGAWAKPSGRDRLNGLWRPLPERPREYARSAVEANWQSYFIGSDLLVRRALKLAAELKLTQAEGQISAVARSPVQAKQVREDALSALVRLKSASLTAVVAELLKDKEPSIRAAAQRVLAEQDPAKALPILIAAIEKGSVPEKQGAFEVLGKLPGEPATAQLRHYFGQLKDGKIPAECRLDLFDAYQRRDSEEKVQFVGNYVAGLEAKNKSLGRFLDCLAGGDAERGKEVLRKQELTCLKCHKLGSEGGEVGPDLNKIGKDKTREYLLESIVKPNAQIAKGYDTLVILTTDGKLVSGVLKSENDKEVRLLNGDDKEVKEIVIPKSKIEERKAGKSAMPEDLVEKMTLRELRDLVEFLANQK